MGKASRVVPSNVALAAGSSSSSDSDSGIFRIFGSQNRKLKKDISKWITRHEADFIECRYKDTSAVVYSVVHNVMDNPRTNALSANSNSVKSTQEVNYLLKGTTVAKVSNSKLLLHMNLHAGLEIPLIPGMPSQNLAIKRVPATINLHSGGRASKMETNKSSMKKKSKGCSLS